MADECIFCKIIKGEIPASKVFEDEHVLAFLDIGPVSEGHCLVVPKDHYKRLDDCPEEVAVAVVGKIGLIAKAILAATDAQGYNLLSNNGRCAGQLVEHVHFHIIPRRPGDGVFTPWPSKEYPPGRAAELTEKIKQHIA